MTTLLIALGAFVGYLIAYHTYGRWLAQRIFKLRPDAIVPSVELNDNCDYVPTRKAIVFGHHFTSIAGTGPIVGPAIAVMWGWLPALLWVFFGSILIGAVHDFGALVVSLRSRGQTVGDVAGRVLNKRVRLLFLFVLFMALTIVMAIFGLVIAAVFRQYPAAIFPCVVQIPIAVVIGVWLHQRGVNLLLPSLAALAIMYLSVIFGDRGFLHTFNTTLAGWPIIAWVGLLLLYSYVASVLPVWMLLQPRDYINSLQLLTALGLIVIGLCVAAFVGGAPPVEGAERQSLEIAAPLIRWQPEGAPLLIPFLFITIACGAISGFHCLVSSGTTSKQLACETDAQFVGYGSMLTEGFLATLVILACVAGLGLGIASPSANTVYTERHVGVHDSVDPRPILYRSVSTQFVGPDGESRALFIFDDGHLRMSRGRDTNTSDTGPDSSATLTLTEDGIIVNHVDVDAETLDATLVGTAAYNTRYQSWTGAGSLAAKVGAFVDGAANFLAAMSIPKEIALALMGVLVASFAGTTLDTACRLQRYVIQELASTFAPRVSATACVACGYDLSFNESGACPECGASANSNPPSPKGRGSTISFNPFVWLTNMHGATIFAILLAAAIAALPAPGAVWSLQTAGTGGLILWPLFGATNQLLGGLAFLVITFWLWRRKLPIWFVVFPMLFMLVMPAVAMSMELPRWIRADSPNWIVIFVAGATLALESWMIVEAILLWPKVRGQLEAALPPIPATLGPTTDNARSC